MTAPLHDRTYLPEGLQFRAPARLILPDSPRLLKSGFTISDISAATFDNLRDVWTTLPIIRATPSSGTVEVEISHFSTYDLYVTIAKSGYTKAACDISKIAGPSTDLIDVLNSVKNGELEGTAPGIGDAVSLTQDMYCDGISALKAWDDGQDLSAIQQAVELVGKTSGKIACERLRTLSDGGNAFAADCQAALDAIYDWSDRLGTYLGTEFWQLADDVNVVVASSRRCKTRRAEVFGRVVSRSERSLHRRGRRVSAPGISNGAQPPLYSVLHGCRGRIRQMARHSWGSRRF